MIITVYKAWAATAQECARRALREGIATLALQRSGRTICLPVLALRYEKGLNRRCINNHDGIGSISRGTTGLQHDGQSC
jgi:hypothetical protein